MENSFGEFLRQQRLKNNLTQKQLAQLLFVSESAVSKWEKDVAHPDITLLPKLVENQLLQKEIDGFNIFNANLSYWQVDVTLEQNIHLIVFLTLLLLAILFCIVGIINYFRTKNKD